MAHPTSIRTPPPANAPVKPLSIDQTARIALTANKLAVPRQLTTRTDYHVAKQNHTGYAQVLEEMQGDVVQESWTIGHDVFLEAVVAGQLRHLLKDGHGSTRQLVDATGAVIDSGTAQVFAYDAYGVPIGFTLANALTTLLYSGEMTDQLTGLQYLRARYYNPATGTFNRLDPFKGNFSDPQSLHKYLYTHGDPVNGIDPSGNMSLMMGVALMAGTVVLSGLVAGIGWHHAGGSFVDGFAAGAFLGGMLWVGGYVAPLLGLIVYHQAAAMLRQTNRQQIVPVPSAQLERDLVFARLAAAAYRETPDEPAELPNWTAIRWYTHDDSPGYRAVLYAHPSEPELVLAYAGTDDGATEFPWYDWQANLWQGLFSGGSQYRHAIADAADAMADTGGNAPIRFVGHSLGGGLASAAAIAYNRPATTFNAAGVHSWTAPGPVNANQLIDAYRVRGEILSTIQDSDGIIGLFAPDGVGTPYYLPATAPDMISRHFMADVFAGMEKMGAPL